MKPNSPNPVPTPTRSLPLHDSIARRAYEIWEKRGRPEGEAVAHWLEAESQLLGANQEITQTPAGPVDAEKLGEALSGNKRRRNRSQPELVTNTAR